MSRAQVDVDILSKQITWCLLCIQRLKKTKSNLYARYNAVSCQRSDRVSQQLKGVLEDCSTSLGQVAQALEDCADTLAVLMEQVQRYQEVPLGTGAYGSQPSSSAAQGAHAAVLSSPAHTLASLGVQSLDLSGIPEKTQHQIAHAFQNMASFFPESVRTVTSLTVTEDLSDHVPAAANFSLENGRLVTVIKLNAQWFRNPDIEHHLNQVSQSGQWAGQGVGGLINHEIGHVMHLQLDAASLGLQLGGQVTALQRLGYINLGYHWSRNLTTNSIRDQVLAEMGLTRDDICEQISEYADTDGSECFAEAVADYTTSPQPSQLSANIIAEYQRRYRELQAPEGG